MDESGCILTELERWQVTAGVHAVVIGTRANVILTLILEILLQIAGKSTKKLLNRPRDHFDPQVREVSCTYA
jgi:hypothetical protein